MQRLILLLSFLFLCGFSPNKDVSFSPHRNIAIDNGAAAVVAEEGGGGGGGSCGSISSWAKTDSIDASDSEYNYLAGMSSTEFVLMQAGDARWYEVTGGDTITFVSATTVQGASARTGVCKVADGVLGVMNNASNRIDVWEHDGDGTLTERIADRTSIGAFGNYSQCHYMSDNRIFVSTDTQGGAVYTYSEGSGFTKVGNTLVILNSSASQGVGAMSDTRVFLAQSGAVDDLEIYDFDGTDWSLTGNVYEGENLTGNISGVGIDENKFVILNTQDDQVQSFSFDGTDITAEATLADSGTDWSSWPQAMGQLSISQYVATSWGEPDVVLLDLTCN